MTRNIKDRYVYCYDCGSRGEINGICKICGHTDVPPLPGIVPNVIGLTEQTATSLITGPEAQLVLGNVTTENSETVLVDKIISSDPVTDTQLNIGDAVNIVISLGPQG